MTTGDPASDLFVLALVLTICVGVLVIPAALLEWLLGPER